MIPMPHQLAGARFLANRRTALLADMPRCGKTGAAIMAADYIMAETVLVITTASGRGVWKRGFADWSAFNRPLQVIEGQKKLDPKTAVAVAGWGGLTSPKIRSELLRRNWSLIILDESHAAKSFEAQRTMALYGLPLEGGRVLSKTTALINKGETIWCLTGTPLPNSPADAYPMMRALCPERLAASGDLPDVTTYKAFLSRYCVVKPKKIGWHRWIDVVIGGRNLEELRGRLDGFLLRRTQEHVGIRPPIYETFPLLVSDKVKREAQAGLDTAKVLAAAEAGDTKKLEITLGPLLRLTGEIKARAVVEVVRDEFDGGLDKIVLMAWHKDAMQILRDGLSTYGVVGIDGATSPAKRAEAEIRFRTDPKTRVFIGQIRAACEAIDLSAASELLFVETTFQPAMMGQAAQRISNVDQTKNTRVRVAVLADSIDEVLQASLMRKWVDIRKVITNAA